MNEIEAIEKSIELWQFLVDEFPTTKECFKEFDLSRYSDKCPLCEYYMGNCHDCVLEKTSCFYNRGPFQTWQKYVYNQDPFKCKDSHTALNAAKSILEKLKTALKKKKGEQKTVSTKVEIIDNTDKKKNTFPMSEMEPGQICRIVGKNKECSGKMGEIVMRTTSDADFQVMNISDFYIGKIWTGRPSEISVEPVNATIKVIIDE